MIKGTTPGDPVRNGLPEDRPYRYRGRHRLDLTRNQAELLGLLRDGGPCTGAALAAAWPARTMEGIRRTAASLRDLGLADLAADGWYITDAGREALDR